jgi:hypothetical protein
MHKMDKNRAKGIGKEGSKGIKICSCSIIL